MNKFESVKTPADQFETKIDYNAREQLLGKKVKAERSSGKIEDDWKIIKFEENSVWVEKDGQEKEVPLEKITRLNPRIFDGIEFSP